MESRILDGSRISKGEVDLQLGSYAGTFVLVGRNDVRRRALWQVDKHRGGVSISPEENFTMLRDARAILIGAQTANATSDCGY